MLTSEYQPENYSTILLKKKKKKRNPLEDKRVSNHLSV